MLKVYNNLCTHKSTQKPFINDDDMNDDDDMKFAKENMLIILLSMLYSVFDPSGLNLADKGLSVPDTLKESIQSIRNKWNCIRQPIARIRNNLGFHGTVEKGTINGTKAFNDLGEKGMEDAFDLIKALVCFARQYVMQRKPS